MTKAQKIAVIVTAVTVSVVVGGLLYLYFNRKSLLKKLQEGEQVEFKTKEPKMERHNGSDYMMKLVDDGNSPTSKALVLYQDGDMKGKYWLIENEAVYVTDKEKTKIRVTDNKEAKVVEYILSK